jgi:hypothetical protein
MVAGETKAAKEGHHTCYCKDKLSQHIHGGTPHQGVNLPSMSKTNEAFCQ